MHFIKIIYFQIFSDAQKQNWIADEDHTTEGDGRPGSEPAAEGEPEDNL